MSVKTRKYYCKNDGCTNEISYNGWKQGTGQCRPCANKETSLRMRGENNQNYKHGKSYNNHCIDCKIEVSKGATRCGPCNKIEISKRYQGENNPFYGKRHTEESKKKAVESRPSIVGENNPMYGTKRPDIVEMNRERLGINNPLWKGGKPKCIDCGKEIGYGRGRCMSCVRKGDRSHSWKNGASFEIYPEVFNEELKSKIKNRDKCTCQNCSITEIEHLVLYKIKLSIHHIDYDKRNCEETNLITLCRQCNSVANFKRDYWKTFFQEKIENVLRYCSN